MTGSWPYLAVFLLMTLAFIGIPAVGCAMLAARYYRHRRARRFAGRPSAGEAGG